MMIIREKLGLSGGILIANPIPEADSMDAETIQSIILDAIAESKEKGISGKDVTPFLLRNIVERTGGASLKANIALVHNNARVGAAMAVAYSNARK